MFALALAVLAGLVVALFVLDIVAYAYRRIGISEGALLSLVWLSLIGGLINIPVARLRANLVMASTRSSSSVCATAFRACTGQHRRSWR